MLAHIDALHGACQDLLREGATCMQWRGTVVPAARTVFESFTGRSTPIDGPLAGKRQTWLVFSAAILGYSSMNEICYHLFLRSRLVRYVLGMDESVSERCIVHSMALYFACIDGHPDLVDRMIELGAASRGLCFPGSSASYSQNKKAFVDAVCEGPSNGWTALMLASMHGHDGCVLRLLDTNADVNKHGPDELTALMECCGNGHSQCVIQLIEAGAELDAIDTYGRTALMFACTKGNEPCALIMIEAGASVNAIDNTGGTALMSACAEGLDICALALIKAGADVDATDAYNLSTPLMSASSNGNHRCMWALLEANADVNAKTEEDGYTALMLACENGHDQCLRMLMAHMANHPFDDVDNVQPYSIEPPETARKWVDEAKNWSSPLHFVDVNPPYRTLSLLRDGANIHASFHDKGPTPLDVALSKGGESASLIIRASEPWSVDTHDLFPFAARRRAYELFKIGILIAASRFEGGEQAFRDVWEFGVMKHAVERTCECA